MASVPVGVAGGLATGAKNTGVPVLGGQFGTNGSSPASAIPSLSPTPGPNQGVSAPITNPVASSGVTGIPSSITPKVGGAILGNPNQAVNTQPTQATAAPTSATATAATNGPANNGNPIAGQTPQQSANLQKQLNDTYGKGEGGELYSLLSNLGSNDSSYLDAYSAALSKSTAEGLSTIDTGLGNAGVSANSSAAAIEKGDYLSGVTTQEGLQEQSLIQNQQQEALQLVEGTEGATAAENSTSWLDTLGQVVDIGASAVGAATGLGGIGQALGGLFKGSIPTLSGGGGAGSAGPAAQLPGAISGGYAGPLPTSIG